MAALRIQGLVDADNYDHAVSIFKSLQAQTGHTVEFQEAAFSEAVEYIKSYHQSSAVYFSRIWWL